MHGQKMQQPAKTMPGTPERGKDPQKGAGIRAKKRVKKYVPRQLGDVVCDLNLGPRGGTPKNAFPQPQAQKETPLPDEWPKHWDNSSIHKSTEYGEGTQPVQHYRQYEGAGTTLDPMLSVFLFFVVMMMPMLMLMFTLKFM